jgi:hypothetical protein
MGLLDDLAAAAARFDAWTNLVATRAREWAASENGQQTLLALDWITLSTRIGDFYERTGWYLPVHLSLQRYALEHVELQRPFDPRAAASLVGPKSMHWAWIVEGTLATPALQSRRELVEDAIHCLEHERWHAAICTLLPIIEGVISDRSGVLQDKRVGRRLNHLLHTQTGPWDALSAIPALSVVDRELFARRDFAKVRMAETALNRHIILHGRSVGFGTEQNAIQTLMLLIALAELLDGAIIFRTKVEPVPPAESSFLDEFGPFAGIREAVSSGPTAPDS